LSSLNPIGFPFIELPTVDSTNNYAMGLVHAGMAQHGAAVFTHEQTKGRGQRNKNWSSQAKSNIAISIVIEPKGLSSSQVFILSKAIAIGTLNFFNSYAQSDVKIKWPNDIYWRDRKAGGILIDNVFQGSDWKYAIAGIGLNINQTHFGELNKAVSLKQITGKDFEPLLLAKELCDCLDKAYCNLTTKPQLIASEYHRNLYKLDQKVKLKKESRIFEATIKDVTALGQLIVEHAAEERFDVGEVEWVI
jgi:BirA family biotin operon repressor/biotin-[acetyl-CoA-carboxylase] ligase